MTDLYQQRHPFWVDGPNMGSDPEARLFPCVSVELKTGLWSGDLPTQTSTD